MSNLPKRGPRRHFLPCFTSLSKGLVSKVVICSVTTVSTLLVKEIQLLKTSVKPQIRRSGSKVIQPPPPTQTDNSNWESMKYIKYLYIIYIFFCRKMPKSPHTETQLSSRDLFIRIYTTVTIRLLGGDFVNMASSSVITHSLPFWMTFFVLKALNMFEIEAKALFCRKLPTQDWERKIGVKANVTVKNAVAQCCAENLVKFKHYHLTDASPSHTTTRFSPKIESWDCWCFQSVLRASFVESTSCFYLPVKIMIFGFVFIVALQEMKNHPQQNTHIHTLVVVKVHPSLKLKIIKNLLKSRLFSDYDRSLSIWFAFGVEWEWRFAGFWEWSYWKGFVSSPRLRVLSH